MKVMIMSCVVALLAAVGCASSAKTSNTEKLTLLGGTKVDVADAIKTALTTAPGRVVDTELRNKHGKTVWEIDIATPDGKIMEVDVDATTGGITDSE